MDAAGGFPKTFGVERDGTRLELIAVNDITLWRARTILDKEPGTVAWLDEFQAGEVLLDVGANVGLYSLMAAQFRRVRAFAFEPESQNYALLNQNIHQNKLEDLVTAYCVALSDESRYGTLFLSQFLVGGSCHSFGESLSPDRKPMRAAFRQGCVATSIDRLVEEAVLPVPNHIKIDVDGLEHKVIAGARKTLENQQLRSVLIEVNTGLEQHWDAVDLMLELGFDYSRSEAERATRDDGPFKGTGNYVFRR
jgi:FkbM family methyltransferase